MMRKPSRQIRPNFTPEWAPGRPMQADDPITPAERRAFCRWMRAHGLVAQGELLRAHIFEGEQAGLWDPYAFYAEILLEKYERAGWITVGLWMPTTERMCFGLHQWPVSHWGTTRTEFCWAITSSAPNIFDEEGVAS